MVLPLIALEDHESLGKGPPKRSECFLLLSTCLRQVPGHMHRALEIQCLGSFKLCSWVTTHLILGRQRWSKHLLIQPKMSVAHGQYLELQRHGPDLISMSNTQTKKKWPKPFLLVLLFQKSGFCVSGGRVLRWPRGLCLQRTPYPTLMEFLWGDPTFKLPG